MASTDARETTGGRRGWHRRSTGVNGPTRARIGVEDPPRRPLVALPGGDVRGLRPPSSSTRRGARSPATNYFAEPYLSPFYSPCLTDDCVAGSSDFGQPFGWWPLSPALLILIFPLGFRLTCYYYRKAYYRAFWLSPPACAVAEPHGKYTGETRFPLIVQNVHRWFWYAAVAGRLVLTYDVVLAFGPAEGESDGIHMGLGTLLMLVNVVCIWLYTLSLPLVPAHHGRPAAALLQAPGPLQALDAGSRSSTASTRSTPGTRCSPWRWSTSTSTCSRPAPSTTRGSSDEQP